MADSRNYTLIDHVLINLDLGLRTVLGKPETTGRKYTDKPIAESDLTETERGQAAGMMRVNHVGEVCAQALYQGQALTSRDTTLKAKLREAANEENDHLAWCAERLAELDSHTSYLNPVWYTGSLLIGVIAGSLGDKWSLGFLAETEHQVVKHLEGHLHKLPSNDQRSRSIVSQMRIDELQHATMAETAGANALPLAVKKLMSVCAKVMTTIAYRV